MRLALFGLILVSCTFPNVQYSDDATAPDATVDATVDDGGGDETTPVEAGDDAFDPCDKDKDGYKSIACDGGDCNDNDPRVNPGVNQFVDDIPDAYPFGDWNCDGTTTYQYPTVTCGLGCSGSQGFASPGPGCGYTGTYENCSYAITCTFTDAGSRIQGCL